MENITPAELRRLIMFEEGKYYWRFRSSEYFSNEISANAWNAKNAGKETLICDTGIGYLRARILGKSYLAHRVIWAYHYGEWPSDQIDHINHDRSDNRIENLRVVSQMVNAKNQKRSKRNKSGFTGVHWCAAKRRWRATIKVGNRYLYLCTTRDKNKAIKARKAAEQKYNFHTNHGAIGA